jgi:hypothetical protein
MNNVGELDLAALLAEAITDYEDRWKSVDDHLYDLCRLRPRHDDPDDVYTKVAIVGRVYSAGVVRNWTDVRDSEYETAKVLVTKAARIEAGLDGLGGRSFDDPDAAGKIVELHRDVIDATHLHPRCGNYLTSFVSKYLHFHCPIVPIFDNEAEAAIGKLVDRSGKRVQEARTALPDAGGPDKARAYRNFVAAFVVLYEDAYATTELEPSVKQLDHMLWWTANKPTNDNSHEISAAQHLDS